MFNEIVSDKQKTNMLKEYNIERITYKEKSQPSIVKTPEKKSLNLLQ